MNHEWLIDVNTDPSLPQNFVPFGTIDTFTIESFFTAYKSLEVNPGYSFNEFKDIKEKIEKNRFINIGKYTVDVKYFFCFLTAEPGNPRGFKQVRRGNGKMKIRGNDMISINLRFVSRFSIRETDSE